MSELTGLARSFDALFATPDPTTSDDGGSPAHGDADGATGSGVLPMDALAPEPEAEAGAPLDLSELAPEADAAIDLADLAPEPQPDASIDLADLAPEPEADAAIDLDALAPEPEVDTAIDLADLAPEPEVDASIDLADLAPEPVEIEPELAMEMPLTSEAASDEAVPSEVAVSLDDAPSLAGSSPTGVDDFGGSEPFAPGSGSAEEDEEEFVPTPLDIAVDGFLAGDVARSGEVELLAGECLEARELDPVARAVARITAAAGTPPDAETYGVAERMMSPPVLGRLARHMGRERDEAKREAYYDVCRTIGRDMAHAIRDDLAENTESLARRVLCQALVEMGPVGREVVEEMVTDENWFMVRNAVTILGDEGGDRAVELVTSALANPHPRVRREALRSLAKLGDPESGAIVAGLLDDSDHDVRIAAAVAAGELRVERAVRPLVTMLEAKDVQEPIPILRALGRIGDPGAVPVVERYTKSSLFSRTPADVRIAAYRALKEIGTPHAMKVLKKAVKEKDPEVKEAVKGILYPR